jgi:phosphatidylinositol-4,5-bisphosphate 3-kinase
MAVRLWEETFNRNGFVDFEFLLPNGLYLPVKAMSNETLSSVRERLWKAAKEMLPQTHSLTDCTQYGFRCVSKKDSELYDLEDDHLVKDCVTNIMYKPVLKVFQRKGTKSEQTFNKKISNLVTLLVQDLDNQRDPEIHAFRRDILSVCNDVTSARLQGGQEAAALHRYPPNIDHTEMPMELREKVSKRGFHVKVKIAGDQQKDFIVKTELDGTAHNLILIALKKKGNGVLSPSDRPENFVFKVSGREEYLLGGHKLSQYKYIRKCLNQGHERKDLVDITVLILEPKAKLYESLRPRDNYPPLPKRAVTDEFVGAHESLWAGPSSEQRYRVRVIDTQGVIVGKLHSICVIAGIFVGEKMIARAEKTRHLPPEENPPWANTLEFEVSLKDLPRNARLCFSLHGVWANQLKVKKNRKNFRNEFPLAWANVCVFDYRGCLRSGHMSLPMWPYEDEEAELFQYRGTSIVNPMRNSGPILSLDFGTHGDKEIRFPPLDQIGQRYNGREEPMLANTVAEIRELEATIKADPLHKLKDREIELLRRHRFHFKNNPQALAKCLKAVDWSRNDAAHEVADMLRLWAALTPEDALELLDVGFSDEMIRRHAVAALETLADDKLISYLLQLVQVLKFECFLNNDLARFLLRRSLKNQRVGHFFFWYLRSEMHVPETALRFGVLLEAYCRGCGDHIIELTYQHESLRKIEEVAEQLKDKSIRDKNDFANKNIQNAKIQPFLLPYDPDIRLSGCECRKVFDSAQKPLWIKFKNYDPEGDDANVMFKCGDDLRQDMLTLQLIRIMDQLWQENDLNLQMNAYECIATGDEVGMLEMVMNSATLWKIQGKVKNVLWDDSVIHEWIKKQNPEPARYDKACDSFLVSCAGYCVATFVLGIADRHNDNIMCTESGQLFHIDFGHFLGNWKAKFGVRRERVKFILVDDFVVAMTKGGNRDSERWVKFKEVCKKAYIVVRKNANLFINLLSMMISTGIPELRSHEDVMYLRETLCLDKTEAEAAELFMAEIDTALRDSKTVRVNWAFHGYKH